MTSTGDGRADIVTANYNPASVSVDLNLGGGKFQGGDYPVAGLAKSIAIGELDGDGKPDLVTTLEGGVRSTDIPHGFSVLINKGDGHFSARRDYETETKPSCIALDDLNADNRADLAIGLGDTVSVLINRGDGTFLAPVPYTIGRQPRSVEAGDLNGDAKPDLVTANAGARTVSVFLNRGDGSFETRQDYQSGGSPSSLAIGDLNGDGKPDLAAANFNRTVSMLLNRGNGTFGPKRDNGAGNTPYSIAIGDFNGDGTPDLATGNSGPGGVSVLLNRGDGSLRPKLDYVPGSDLYGSLSIGDLNGDGKPDIAVPIIDTRNGWSDLSLLINRPGLCNVEYVLGMTLPAAKRTLARINCRVGRVRYAFSKTVKRGRVISQKPLFGAVRPNGGKVNLVISRGRRR